MRVSIIGLIILNFLFGFYAFGAEHSLKNVEPGAMVLDNAERTCVQKASIDYQGGSRFSQKTFVQGPFDTLRYVMTAMAQEHYKGTDIVGNYAYIVDGWPWIRYDPGPYVYNYNGLVIYDISDYLNPVKVGYIDLPGNGYGVEVHGDYAYVSNLIKGIQIIDISDPTNPVLLSNYYPGNWSFYLTVVDTLAYLGSNYGLEIINVADPLSPFRIGRVNLDRVFDVVVNGDYAYAANTGNAAQDLAVVDISDPTSPFVVGRSGDIPGTPICVAVQGNIVYIGGDSGGGFASINVSNPSNPILLDAITTSGISTKPICLSGIYAYVGDYDKLLVIDVSNPNNLILKGSCGVPGRYGGKGSVYGIDVVEGHAYVGAYNARFSVVDITNPSNPFSVVNNDFADFSKDVALDDTLLYVAASSNGLIIFDVAEPNVPIFLGCCDTPGSAKDVAANGNYAYIAYYEYPDTRGLAIIDVSDPTSPNLIGDYDPGAQVIDVEVCNDTVLCLALDNLKMVLLNVANPDAPFQISELDDVVNAELTVQGDFVFAKLSGDMNIIDISDLLNPFLETSITLNSRIRDLVTNGNRLYAALHHTDYDGMDIVDISDPSNPNILGAFTDYPWSSVYGVAVHGITTCLVDHDGGGGVALIDVTDPGYPALIGSMNAPNQGQRAVMDPYHIYMADFYDFPIYYYHNSSGTADISTNPPQLIFNYGTKALTLAPCPSETRISFPIIDQTLTEKMADYSNEKLIPVFIMISEQINSDLLIDYAYRLDKDEKRTWVVSQLQSLAQQTQQVLLSYLESEEQKGRVANLRSLWIVNAISLKTTGDVIEKLSIMPGVCQISYDGDYFHVLGEPVSYRSRGYYRGLAWGVEKIRADQVWALGYTGDGIIIGNLDTGVNYNHNDLADHMWNGGTLYPHHGWDFVNADNDPMDDHGHGTHTAGTAAGDGTSGTQTGVAPDAQIMALKVLNASGSGNFSDIASGIQFAIEHGAHVISLSVGAENPNNATKDYCRNMCGNAFAADLPMAISAGNGVSGSPGSHYSVPHDIHTPADVPAPWYGGAGHSASIAVGATDVSDVIANFSSYGPTEWNTSIYNDYPYPPGLMKPDVSAPGVNITSLSYSNNTGYIYGWSGTSMACPHLAGTIALMLEKNPLLTSVEIDSIVELTSVDLGVAGRDTLYGAGRIDAYSAVLAISATSARKMVFWILNSATATRNLEVSDITWSASWIKDVSPTQPKVGIGDSIAVNVYADSAGIPAPGTYWDTLCIYSNDPDENPYPEPICLVTVIVGIEEAEESKQLPLANALYHTRPNPFTSAAQISYAIAKESKVRLEIYNVLGQRIRTLINRKQEPGCFDIDWDGKDELNRGVPSGVYYIKLSVGDRSDFIEKVILLQ